MRSSRRSAGTFCSDFKGSLLETVLDGITEQKEVFEGAAHTFYWKPKLRILDIYENEENKRAFADLFDAFLGSMVDDRLTGAVLDVELRRIKGLGPAVANILYFPHPTRWPPSNTAMPRGFNALFGAKNAVRRVINLRLKGPGIIWEEENVEKMKDAPHACT